MDTKASIRAIIFPWHQKVSMISTKGAVQFLEVHVVVMIPIRLSTTFKIVELIRYVSVVSVVYMIFLILEVEQNLHLYLI